MVAATHERRLMDRDGTRETGRFMLAVNPADGLVKPKPKPHGNGVKLAFDTSGAWRDGAPQVWCVFHPLDDRSQPACRGVPFKDLWQGEVQSRWGDPWGAKGDSR